MSETSPPVQVNSSQELREDPGPKKSKKRTHCEHKNRKDHCKICYVCEHGKRKDQCPICYDCGHGKLRYNCHICRPLEELFNQKRQCHLCTEKRIGHKRARAGVFFCATCDEKVPDRTELVVRKLLLAELGPNQIPSAADDTLIGGCGFGRQRPDLAFVFPDRVIIIEVDENGGHPNQASSCESTRMSNIAEAIHISNQVVPVVFLRFNPDRYHQSMNLEDRISGLVQLFQRQTTIALDTFVYVHYAYQHKDCAVHIEYARQFFKVDTLDVELVQFDVVPNHAQNELQSSDLFE